MTIKAPQWSAPLRRLRGILRTGLGPSLRLQARNWIAAEIEDIRAKVRSFVFQLPTVLAAAVLWEFLEPGSTPFFLAIIGIVTLFVLMSRKFYGFAALAFVVLVGFVPVLFLSASYYVVSDQLRLRYRANAGHSYAEFSNRIPPLSSIITSLAPSQLIRVGACGDAKLAKLPLLPYEPIYAQKDIINSPFGFRRLPPIQVERIGLDVETTSSKVQDGEHKRELSIAFAVSDAGAKAILPVTQLFPRSLLCMENRVPLLPLLEVLPWDPDDVGSLIKTISKVDQLRKVYPDGVLSFDNLLQLRMDENEGQYGPLLDFFIYSVTYHMFSGNALAEVRADIGNKLCVIADSRPSAFSGPFAALPENFQRYIVADAGLKYQLAYPACHVSKDILAAFQVDSEHNRSPPPFFSAFEQCLENAIEVTKCLLQDDVPQPESGCNSPSCANGSEAIFSELLFEVYDERFFAVASKTDGVLVAINSIKPSECPQLRDKREQAAFVEWWIRQPAKIVTKPFQCSSPDWNREYSEGRATAKDALSCAERWRVQNVINPYEALDRLYDTKCNQGNDTSKFNDLGELYKFLDTLPAQIEHFKKYSSFVGHRRVDAVVKAFETLDAMKQAVCGAMDTKPCTEAYTVFGVQGLIKKLYAVLGLPLAGDFNEAQILDYLTSLNNVMIDMAICDLLQDDDLRQTTGYDRDAYCDGHGLEAYRVAGSQAPGHLVERAVDDPKGRLWYLYQSNGHDRESLIKVPVE